MADKESNTTEIALLKQQARIFETELAEIKIAVKDVAEQLSIFNGTVKTGKWIVVSILVAVGALGHKGIVWASNFLAGN